MFNLILLYLIFESNRHGTAVIKLSTRFNNLVAQNREFLFLGIKRLSCLEHLYTVYPFLLFTQFWRLYGDILLLFTCKIKYVNMHHNFVHKLIKLSRLSTYLCCISIHVGINKSHAHVNIVILHVDIIEICHHIARHLDVKQIGTYGTTVSIVAEENVSNPQKRGSFIFSVKMQLSHSYEFTKK